MGGGIQKGPVRPVGGPTPPGRDVFATAPKRSVLPANDNRQPIIKSIAKWAVRLRGLILPVVGAAILIYAMTH